MEINNGWIKIHRKMQDNPIIMKDADHLAVWMYLLLNATHAEYPALFKGEKIMLQPGQLITGRKSIAAKLSINESKVTRILDAFGTEQQIEQQASNRNRLISILNWDLYQSVEQQSEQQVNNKKGKKHTSLHESGAKNGQQNEQQEQSKTPLKSGICDTLGKKSEQQNEQQVNNKRTTEPKKVNTNKNNNNKNNKNVRKIYSENPILNNTILEFIEYRESIKKPMTDHAVDLMIGKLQKMTADVNVQIEILNQSIMNGWTGIFPLKKDQQTSGRKEVVPSWMDKPKNKFHNFNQRSYDGVDLEEMLLTTNPPTAGTDANIQARVEELKERLGSTT